MGILLDSSVVITADRAQQTATEFLEDLRRITGDQLFVMSAVGYAEIRFGVYREENLERLKSRERFFAELREVIAVEPLTDAIADLAARLGAEQASLGKTVPFADLMIGATAISLDFGIGTTNERHFRLIPGLRVIAI